MKIGNYCQLKNSLLFAVQVMAYAIIIANYACGITTLFRQITTLIIKNSTLIQHMGKRLGGTGKLL